MVALGERAFHGVLHAFGLPRPRLRAAVEDLDGTVLPNGTRLFAVYHCNTRVQHTVRTLTMQRRDWARIAPFLTDS